MIPSFITGTTVRIRPDFYIAEFPSETTENWGGQIVDYREDLEGRMIYEVQLDATTLKNYSPEYLECLAKDELNVEVYCFLEEDLIHSPQRGTEEEREEALELIMEKYWEILDDLYDEDEDEDEEDEDFGEVALFKKMAQALTNAKPSLKPWAKFSKNATITVVYKDGKQKTGKFKRLEVDLNKGLCDLL